MSDSLTLMEWTALLLIAYAVISGALIFRLSDRIDALERAVFGREQDGDEQ